MYGVLPFHNPLAIKLRLSIFSNWAMLLNCFRNEFYAITIKIVGTRNVLLPNLVLTFLVGFLFDAYLMSFASGCNPAQTFARNFSILRLISGQEVKKKYPTSRSYLSRKQRRVWALRGKKRRLLRDFLGWFSFCTKTFPLWAKHFRYKRTNFTSLWNWYLHEKLTVKKRFNDSLKFLINMSAQLSKW